MSDAFYMKIVSFSRCGIAFILILFVLYQQIVVGHSELIFGSCSLQFSAVLTEYS
jgi:hypothetical protein